MPSFRKLYHLSLLLLFPLQLTASENDFYRLTTYNPPDKHKMEISGFAPLPDGRMAVSTRKGEVWIITAPNSPENATFELFASGLHEPLGLAWHQEALYAVQRTELTRIRDTDGDNRADEFLTIAKGWGVTGNYHEYAYGPKFDHEGNAWLTLNIGIGKGVSQDDAWRGWSLVVPPSGQWRPMSAGFRSPAGIGINSVGDVFATDQQGNWFGTCPLIHIQKGAFHGHADSLKDTMRPSSPLKLKRPLPKGLTVAQAAKAINEYTLPAVWFPYRKMGMSSTDIVCDSTRGAFGPFSDQLFVGEFTMSMISRVYLEKVNGVYQGACFPFRKGFQSAVLRLEWSSDGSLMVGQSNRGWNSLGPKSYGLQRLAWTGKMPFEIQELQARSNGFVLKFTLAVDLEIARDPSNYKLSSYTYNYHQTYGSEEIDTKLLTIESVTVSEDARSVQLSVSPLRAGYVHELDASALQNNQGKALLHSKAYYTLNQIPLEAGKPGD